MTYREEGIEAVYQFIRLYKEDGHGSPTLREISESCDLSVTTVNEYLSHLEAQGKIERAPYKSRSIRLVDVENPRNETAEEVLSYIEETLAKDEYPSQLEIAKACLLSRAEVRRALAWLEGQGRIERDKGQRNIRIIERKS